MTSAILSTSICMVAIFGAYGESSFLGSAIAFSMTSFRIYSRDLQRHNHAADGVRCICGNCAGQGRADSYFALDVDCAIVLCVDFAVGFLHNLLDHLAPCANDLRNLVHINLHGRNLRRMMEIDKQGRLNFSMKDAAEAEA